MSFLKFLQGIGDRLGILETVEAAGTEPSRRIQTRTVTLAELSSEIKAAEVQALADSQSELQIPFEKIFEAANIPSASEDWTIEAIKQFVSIEPLKNQPKEKIQAALLDKLKADNVQIEEVLKNAIARDQALDSFENSVREKIQVRSDAKKEKIQDMELKIRDLQKQISHLGETNRSDEVNWTAWKKRKRAYEQELALVVSYIVAHPVITTDDD
jgi:hypothetical protein